MSRSGCSRSASRRATGSASGRRTAPSGPCSSSRAARSGAILVNVNPAYRPRRARVRAAPVRRAAARHRRGVQDVGLSRHARPGARRPARARAGGHHRHRASRPTSTTWCGTSFVGLGVVGGLDLLREREASLDCDDPINIQYTSGTTGNPKGATLTHHNILNNAPADRGGARLHRGGPGVHPRAAVPLLRHGRRQPRLRHERVDDGVPGAQLRAAGHARGDRGGAVHEHLRRAHDVHRAARAPAVRRLRPHVACAPGSWPARRARSR